MNTALVIAWLGALLGGALVGVGVIVPMMQDLDVRAVITTLQKMLASHQPERVRQVCKAAPGGLLDAVLAGLDGGSAAFEREATRLVRARKVRVEMTMIGVLLSLGALGQAADQLVGNGTLIGVHVLIWLAGGWVWLKRDRVARDLAQLRRELLPQLAS